MHFKHAWYLLNTHASSKSTFCNGSNDIIEWDSIKTLYLKEHIQCYDGDMLGYLTIHISGVTVSSCINQSEYLRIKRALTMHRLAAEYSFIAFLPSCNATEISLVRLQWNLAHIISPIIVKTSPNEIYYKELLVCKQGNYTIVSKVELSQWQFESTMLHSKSDVGM